MIKQNGVGSLKLQAKPVGNATFRLLASHHSFFERRAVISEKNPNNNKLKNNNLVSPQHIDCDIICVLIVTQPYLFFSFFFLFNCLLSNMTEMCWWLPL